MGLAVINLLCGELCISLLSVCWSWPAVNYRDAEKINHVGHLMSTPEKPSDGVPGASSPLQCEQRGSSDNSGDVDREPWNSNQQNISVHSGRKGEEMLTPHTFRG